MNAWRHLSGWRALPVLTGGIVVLVAALLIAMTVIELPVAEYASYADVVSVDSVERSWLPPFLPRNAVAIREVHDLDTQERWISFQTPPNTLRTLLRDWKALPWSIARQSVHDRPWRVGGDWPPELSRLFWHTARDTRLLRYHRHAATSWCLAVEWRTGRAWAWTCDADRTGTPVDSQATYFGIYDADTRMNYFADPMLGHIERQRWAPDSVRSEVEFDRVVRRFTPGAVYDGLDSLGRPVRVAVDSVPKPMGDLYVGALAAHLVQPATDSVGPVLFWQGPVRPTVLYPREEQLTAAIEARLRAAGDSVFALARREADPDDSVATMRLRALRVESVPGADSLLVAHAAADVMRAGGAPPDERGQLLAILTRRSLAVQYASFGHPEWSPHAKTVRGITPVLYFTLPGDPRVLLFATDQGPWEDNGFGILDLATGARLAR